jgi:membrane-associated protease RseP (regulator of RpoE activity)
VIEKSLADSGYEKAVEAQAERIAEEIERQTETLAEEIEKQAEQGASAEEINRAVEKALKDANVEEQIRRVVEQARRLSEEAAAKVRALQEERERAIERAKKRGRSGQAERRRLEQALRRDQQRLQTELRRRQQALQRELRRLNEALPQAPGMRAITVDLAPELAKIAQPTREMVRAALETALAQQPAVFPAPAAAPGPGATRLLPAPAAVPMPVPAPAAPQLAMAAPEVRFWSGRSAGDAGVTYAVPIERVRWALEQIREHGRVRHAYLGVRFDTLSAGDRERLKAPDEARVRVVGVMKDSPAEEAGLRVDDLILELDGRKLADAGEMVSRMSRARVGDRVSLTIWRDGERRTLQATLRERPQAMNPIQLRNIVPKVQVAPLVVTPPKVRADTLRSFVRVGPAGHVAASAAGTGRAARITLDARDAELESVLRELSRATGLQFRAGPEAAKRRVTLKVENVSIDDLVESLNRLYNLRGERQGDGYMFRIR